MKSHVALFQIGQMRKGFSSTQDWIQVWSEMKEMAKLKARFVDDFQRLKGEKNDFFAERIKALKDFSSDTFKKRVKKVTKEINFQFVGRLCKKIKLNFKVFFYCKLSSFLQKGAGNLKKLNNTWIKVKRPRFLDLKLKKRRAFYSVNTIISRIVSVKSHFYEKLVYIIQYVRQFFSFVQTKLPFFSFNDVIMNSSISKWKSKSKFLK